MTVFVTCSLLIQKTYVYLFIYQHITNYDVLISLQKTNLIKLNTTTLLGTPLKKS